MNDTLKKIVANLNTIEGNISAIKRHASIVEGIDALLNSFSKYEKKSYNRNTKLEIRINGGVNLLKEVNDLESYLSEEKYDNEFIPLIRSILFLIKQEAMNKIERNIKAIEDPTILKAIIRKEETKKEMPMKRKIKI